MISIIVPCVDDNLKRSEIKVLAQDRRANSPSLSAAQAHVSPTFTCPYCRIELGTSRCLTFLISLNIIVLADS